MDAIIGIDRAIFYLVNTRLTSSFLDFFMPFITSKSNFTVVMVILWVGGLIVGRWKSRQALILLLLVVTSSDFLSSSIFKELFQRVRPCVALDHVHLLVGCGGSFSFPSSHATNIFAAMVWLSLHYRKALPLFLIIALLVSYSRIYVGVHYPLDVIGGACLGTSIAFLFIVVEVRLLPPLIHYCKHLKVAG
ncbi:MAG: phosphatase PAP2 family protein [Deltaproteobacteria bacterium]|nr:phosphatase PAP2 family protein [Deltaproteobacteria bacterium]